MRAHVFACVYVRMFVGAFFCVHSVFVGSRSSSGLEGNYLPDISSSLCGSGWGSWWPSDWFSTNTGTSTNTISLIFAHRAGSSPCVMEGLSTLTADASVDTNTMSLIFTHRAGSSPCVMEGLSTLKSHQSGGEAQTGVGAVPKMRLYKEAAPLVSTHKGTCTGHANAHGLQVQTVRHKDAQGCTGMHRMHREHTTRILLVWQAEARSVCLVQIHSSKSILH